MLPAFAQWTLANSAGQLMRSRYSAYVVGNIAYIVQTTLPAQPPLLNVPAIGQWSKQNQWLGLNIVTMQPKLKPRPATVEFIARFNDGREKEEAEQQHRELSGFVPKDGRWYFLDPTVQPMPSLKSPCFCDSGQKFKHCCARFLGLL